VIVFGAEGSLTDTGFVFVGANTHGVNSFLKNEHDPNSFNLVTITQRQRIGEQQKEAVTIRCVKCKEIVAQFAFDATPPPANHHAAPTASVRSRLSSIRRKRPSSTTRAKPRAVARSAACSIRASRSSDGDGPRMRSKAAPRRTHAGRWNGPRLRADNTRRSEAEPS